MINKRLIKMINYATLKKYHNILFIYIFSNNVVIHFIFAEIKET
jgi:hypothetical protein